MSSGSLFPSFCFPLAPFQSVLLVLSGALVGLPGSLLFLQPGYRSSSSQFTVVWLVLRLLSLQPYTCPLFGLLPVPPFLLSGSRRCVLSLTLGFSVPLPVSSSWAPLSRFSSSAASSPGYSLGFWILPLCSSWLLPPTLYSRLASCFCFLERVPGPQLFRGFLSCFPGLSISQPPTCFDLELFLGFLSCRLLILPLSWFCFLPPSSFRPPSVSVSCIL